MFTLLLVGLFTAFFLAVLSPLMEFLEIFIGSPLAVEAGVSLAISCLANWLVGTQTVKGFIVKAVAGSFLGSFIYKLAERVLTRPSTVYESRQ